ncbi:MAG: ATP-dependent zinc metalloprotease FtsH, partial [Thermoanaerobaculia bacterium]
SFSNFLETVKEGKVAEVEIKGAEIVGNYKDKKNPNRRYPDFKTYAPPYEKLVDILTENNVSIKVKEVKESTWLTILISWGPFILLIVLWIGFMRQIQSGGNKALSFGKSRAKVISPSQVKTTFKDVAGVDEAKEELLEIIEFLKDPKKFQKLGGRIPKGVLLVGPPGTGKTLLAKAIAGEAGVPFISISGSEFVEMFVGVGASRVRDLFDLGEKNAPSIIFIDEIDAVGRHRGAGLGGGHDEREQTLNQLLVEMDGFDSNEGLIIMAATNRPDILDPALLRPGRFDRRIVINRPDLKGRYEILKVHTKKIPLKEDVKLEVIARSTPGFSGADLANLVNEAALIAARRKKEQVDMEDFEYAKDKVLMGIERRSMIISDEEKRTTAYHEAGHALVSAMLKEADPIHKVTIIPRGMALGVTQQLPVDDRYTYSKDYLLAQISVMMGGRTAEELFLNKISTGAGNDLATATELARKMVCDWGMSDLGPVTFGSGSEEIFLGKDLVRHQNYSESTAIKIDEEISKIINFCYGRAKEILMKNSNILQKIATILLEREVLEGEEIYKIIEEETGEKLAKTPKPIEAN